MVTNASIEYLNAEKKYLRAKTDEERLAALEEMLKFMPKHKGAEQLRANLRARYAKLKAKLEEKQKKQKKQSKHFKIEKQGIQVCIYGFTKSGKSLLLSLITNAKPKISDAPFTTVTPEIGMLSYNDVDFQLIEFPSLVGIVDDDRRWLSYALTTDLILVLVKSINDAEKIIKEFFEFNENTKDKPILIIVNGHTEFREEKITFEISKSIRCNIKVIFCDITQCINEIKASLFSALKIYRIYLKKPEAKQPEARPLVFLNRPTIQDVLKEIKISSEKLLKALVAGKSVKFAWQAVNVNHELEDKDIVEFYFSKY
ncbi:MAG: GTPase [Candidatus Pacearchaeota archaeon]